APMSRWPSRYGQSFDSCLTSSAPSCAMRLVSVLPCFHSRCAPSEPPSTNPPTALPTALTPSTPVVTPVFAPATPTLAPISAQRPAVLAGGLESDPQETAPSAQTRKTT